MRAGIFVCPGRRCVPTARRSGPVRGLGARPCAESAAETGGQRPRTPVPGPGRGGRGRGGRGGKHALRAGFLQVRRGTPSSWQEGLAPGTRCLRASTTRGGGQGWTSVPRPGSASPTEFSRNGASLAAGHAHQNLNLLRGRQLGDKPRLPQILTKWPWTSYLIFLCVYCSAGTVITSWNCHEGSMSSCERVCPRGAWRIVRNK